MFTARELMIALMLVAGAAGPAWGQYSPVRIYSNPTLPAADTLRKLDLRLAWSNAVPMDGKHDRITFILIDRYDLFVLSHSGQVIRINAETGRVEWKSRPGRAYTAVPYLAVNQRSVYVILNATMYSLDRERGVTKWEYSLPGGLATAPVVDAEQIYVPRSDSTLSAFTLPFVTLTKEGSPVKSLIYSKLDADAGAASRPRPRWSILTHMDFAFQPITSPESVFIVGPSGRGRAFHKFPPAGASAESFRFETEGRISVPPSGYGNMGLIGCDDANLYAMNIDTGKLMWRYTAGTAIRHRPAAIEADVYVTSEREGMARVNRATGEPMWRVPVGGTLYGANPDADRFLAASNRFVYALTRTGDLLVLDRRRGVTLARMDKTAFRVPIVNQITDRLYLAANDGTIVCLHDRELPEPIRHRKKLEDAALALTKMLDATVDERPGPPAPLEDVLTRMRARYGVNYLYATELLKAAKLENIGTKEVSPREFEGKPLKEVYRSLLKQVDADYRIEDNTLMIVPLDKAPKKDDKEPKDDMEDKAPKKDDKAPKKDDKKDDKDDKKDD
jgi:eukaryotic-like serine/threonine-protein kinase